MARKTVRSVKVDPNVRCQRLYPTEKTARTIGELKTIGLHMTREQALHLARVLIVAAQDWAKIDITGYRFGRRNSDGTFHVTVTSGE